MDSEKDEMNQADITALHHFYSKHIRDLPDEQALTELFAQVNLVNCDWCVIGNICTQSKYEPFNAGVYIFVSFAPSIHPSSKQPTSLPSSVSLVDFLCNDGGCVRTQ